MTATPGPGAPNTSNAQPHHGSVANKLNWLRAAVLGANDGIVSTAGIVIGVAAATVERGPVLTAGIAGLAAGALSMAVGEYVSVSTQRDTERALLDTETQELSCSPTLNWTNWLRFTRREVSPRRPRAKPPRN